MLCEFSLGGGVLGVGTRCVGQVGRGEKSNSSTLFISIREDFFFFFTKDREGGDVGF